MTRVLLLLLTVQVACGSGKPPPKPSPMPTGCYPVKWEGQTRWMCEDGLREGSDP